jgi:hypothetical protein
MANLQDIISLAKADGGKFFVMDEAGDVKLVILNIEDYQKMHLGKQKKQTPDVEKINREITKAQLQEPEVIVPQVEDKPFPAPTVESQQMSYRSPRKYQDLREEVIDPSFDFEGPKLNLDDL